MSRSTPKILFLMAHPIDDASCRYRVQQFVPFLERAGYQCTVSSFGTRKLFRSLRSKGAIGTKLWHTLYCSVRRVLRLLELSDFDLIVIHREVFPFLTPAFEKWVLRKHKNVIFGFDDAIYAGHGDVSTLNHPLLYRFKYGRGVDEVIRRCAHVIAGNRILAKYAEKFNSHVSTIPTVVDCTLFSYKAQADGRLPLTVGWMGSRSTVSYLKPIEPALRRLSECYPGKVHFRFYGCPAYQPDIPNLVSLPFDLNSEIEDLGSLDIGLMPLPDNTWTRGKCAFKAIQYMARGIPTIASPVGVTEDLIRHDHNGLLANSVDDWYRALEHLVTDFETRCRLSINGRRMIEESYSLEVWGPRLVSLIDDLAGQALPVVRRHPTLSHSPRAVESASHE